jgi:hypothetical protein
MRPPTQWPTVSCRAGWRSSASPPRSTPRPPRRNTHAAGSRHSRPPAPPPKPLPLMPPPLAPSGTSSAEAPIPTPRPQRACSIAELVSSSVVRKHTAGFRTSNPPLPPPPPPTPPLAPAPPSPRPQTACFVAELVSSSAVPPRPATSVAAPQAPRRRDPRPRGLRYALGTNHRHDRMRRSPRRTPRCPGSSCGGFLSLAVRRPSCRRPRRGRRRRRHRRNPRRKPRFPGASSGGFPSLAARRPR